MSRYDKYDPKVGGFRAPLAANFGYTASVPDFKHADLGKLFAAGLNTSGQVGKFGGSFPTFAGVIILTRPKAAGDIVDIMTSGEIVDLVDAEIKTADTLTAGQRLYADPALATGVLTTTATAMKPVGFTVELNATTGYARLVVRAGLGSGTGA
jgi:hypothetical protein